MDSLQDRQEDNEGRGKKVGVPGLDRQDREDRVSLLSNKRPGASDQGQGKPSHGKRAFQDECKSTLSWLSCLGYFFLEFLIASSSLGNFPGLYPSPGSFSLGSFQ